MHAFKENARVLSRRALDDPETNELDPEKHIAFTSYGTYSTVFKYLKKLVNRERKTCRERYYESRIQHLKDEHLKRWWDEMKHLSGTKTKNGDLYNQINVNHFADIFQVEQANFVNAAFLEPLEK